MSRKNIIDLFGHIENFELLDVELLGVGVYSVLLKHNDTWYMYVCNEAHYREFKFEGYLDANLYTFGDKEHTTITLWKEDNYIC